MFQEYWSENGLFENKMIFLSLNGQFLRNNITNLGALVQVGYTSHVSLTYVRGVL